MLVDSNWLRNDLINLKQYVHHWYKPGQVHNEIASVLMDDKIKKAIIVIPPQFGKTELLCGTFPSFYISQNPNNSVIVGTYNQDYANKLSVKTADFFTSREFQNLHNLRAHPDFWNKRERLLRDYNGGVIFAGIGAAVTGSSAHLLLLDDLTKDFEDACSKLKQEAIYNWFKTVGITRLQDENSRIIIVMTRWIKNDLIGKLLKNSEDENIPEEDKFKLYHYAALYDNETKEPASKELITAVANGEEKQERLYSLWPEKKSVKFLLDRFRDGPAEFYTMYQGVPRDLENNVIKREWIQVDDDIKKYGEIKYSCRGWDFGYTVDGNYTVGSRIDVYELGETMYPILSDVVMTKQNPTGVKEFVAETAKRDGVSVYIALESGGTQIAMASEIMNHKELYDYTFYKILPKGDKVSRAMSWILKLEDGIFRLKKGAWNKKVMDSLCDFSLNCEADDIEDSITTAYKTLFGTSK